MKRDMELVRKILLELESKPNDYELFKPTIEGYSDEEISYHIGKLYEGGFVDAVNHYGNDKNDWYAKTMTWNGHEFLDLARNESIWNKAREVLADGFKTISIEGMKLLLNKLFSDQISKLLP